MEMNSCNFFVKLNLILTLRIVDSKHNRLIKRKHKKKEKKTKRIGHSIFCLVV